MHAIILNPYILSYIETDYYLPQYNRGVGEIEELGLVSPLGFAAGHLILIGHPNNFRLINGYTFQAISVASWEEAVDLISQVTPLEHQRYDEEMTRRANNLDDRLECAVINHLDN
jgi:hypothetical protein